MITASSDARFATLLQEFFLERLINQRNASPQTVAAYRDSFRLLLRFVERDLRKPPERLALTDLDAPTVLAFLNHLEQERHNTIRSRNARRQLLLPVGDNYFCRRRVCEGVLVAT
jgi:site-specific recombinase XerD